MGKQRRYVGIAVEAPAQSRLQHRLRESVALWKAVIAAAGCDSQKACSFRGVVIGSVVPRDIAKDIIHEARCLHRAQRLVVDRDRSRLDNGRAITFDEDDTHARLAKQVGSGQTCRPGAENSDVALVIDHFSFLSMVSTGSKACFLASRALRPRDAACCSYVAMFTALSDGALISDIGFSRAPQSLHQQAGR
ncbi:hypothetical protein D3C87_1601310 [compost metagenome]